MPESLPERVMRLISTGAEAFVSGLKALAPEAALEDALREVDLTIEQGREELGKCVAAGHLASKRLAEQRTEHLVLSERAQRAVDQGRDDLAQAAISQQLALEAELAALEQEVKEAQALAGRLERCLQALLEARRELEARGLPDPEAAGPWGDGGLAQQGRGLYQPTHEERVQARLLAMKAKHSPKRRE